MRNVTPHSPESPGIRLRVTGVSKRHGEVRALEGVNLQVNAGEFVVLLGPNGAGKTTLFGVLTGLFTADSGAVFIDDRPLHDNLAAALSTIGVVFQQPALDLEMTVLQNLRFHARLQGLPRREREARIRELLEAGGLASVANQPARTLSGGSRRRVEILRAVLHEPSLLLMDEPTAGLDPAARADLLRQVKADCTDSKRGVLWATHLLDETENADRVVILHRGAVLADLSPARLRALHPSGDVAEAFLQLTGDGAASA